jgi:dihydrofolate synthase/folylpolyglutamate synthase
MEGRELSVRVTARDLEAQTLDLAGPGWRLDGARISLLGTFQPSNGLLAAAAARALGVEAGAMRAGLARARWPGRFEVLRAGDRHVVLDGAHNPAGARALAASLAEWFGETPLTLIFGAFRDKDVAGMLAPLAARARRVILTAASSARAAAPDALRAHVPAGPERVETAASAGEALGLAARPPWTPVLCVAGSLSLIGDVLRHAQGSDRPCSIEKPAASMGSLF